MVHTCIFCQSQKLTFKPARAVKPLSLIQCDTIDNQNSSAKYWKVDFQISNIRLQISPLPHHQKKRRRKWWWIKILGTQRCWCHPPPPPPPPPAVPPCSSPAKQTSYITFQISYKLQQILLSKYQGSDVHNYLIFGGWGASWITDLIQAHVYWALCALGSGGRKMYLHLYEALGSAFRVFVLPIQIVANICTLECETKAIRAESVPNMWLNTGWGERQFGKVGLENLKSLTKV